MDIFPLESLTAQDWTVIAGILGVPATIAGAWVTLRKAKPEAQALVMSTGETGVKILDSIVDTLQTELARKDLTIEALEARLTRRDAYIVRMQDEHREAMSDKDARIRELVDMVRDARSKHIEELERELRVLNAERAKAEKPVRRRRTGDTADPAGELRSRIDDLKAQDE